MSDPNRYAFELARTVLDGAPPPAPHRPTTGVVELDIRMEALIHGVRQRIMLQGFDAADQIAAEIERQCSAVNLADVVKASVRRALDVHLRHLEERVNAAVERAVDAAVEAAVQAKQPAITAAVRKKLGLR